MASATNVVFIDDHIIKLAFLISFLHTIFSSHQSCAEKISMDLFANTMAILNYFVSNSYYGMLMGQASMYLPPNHS